MQMRGRALLRPLTVENGLEGSTSRAVEALTSNRQKPIPRSSTESITTALLRKFNALLEVRESALE